MIPKDVKIYVAGHRGLVGSAIHRELKRRGYTNIITRTHSELDLCDQSAVNRFFDEENPEVVILAAAKVGGIGANSTKGADFILENLQIETNVISSCYNHDTSKLVFLGSTCIYPKAAQESGVPMKEEMLLTSDLETSNEPYAIAKIAGLKMCEAFNRQYGTNYISVQPTNLYGYGDNFDLDNSHVLPAMMRKIHIAKMLMDNDLDGIRSDFRITSSQLTDKELYNYLKLKGIHQDRVVLWGTGNPSREFLWSDDLAHAVVYLMECINADQLPDRNSHINIGTGIQHKLSEVANTIASIVGYGGMIEFDHDHPDGTMQKVCDVTKIHNLGWHHTVELEEGIRLLYDWYKKS